MVEKRYDWEVRLINFPVAMIKITEKFPGSFQEITRQIN